ncbi:MAG: hydroxymethylbilane synthase [Desulfobacterales bacterium]|nr:hydroxymethylbilane synthase [Desulfobacterales bacterium]
MKDLVRIGTRKSKLALWQAYFIEDLLKKIGLATEIVPIETKGDKILNVSIAKIGSKGVFTEEIEEQLKNGNIDIAVHSAKDMQSDIGHDFEIIAFTKREIVNDVVVSMDKAISIEDFNREIKVGTSSVRRISFLKHFYPNVKPVEIRGNLQTRISKLENGLCDVLILAYAGVYRMNLTDMIRFMLPKDKFIPPVGQASIAVEASVNLLEEKKQIIRSTINDYDTEKCIIAERAFLKTLQGGCSVPVFALAEFDEGKLSIKGGIVSLDGKIILQDFVSGQKAEAIELGKNLATSILEKGGEKLLKEIKNDI